MGYQYHTMKHQLFTDEGNDFFVKTRDKAMGILKETGAFKGLAAFNTGDTWLYLACLDRMIETGEIRRVTEDEDRFAQDHIYELA